MSLNDEIRVGQTPDQRATAETYGRSNDGARNEIARQMAEFERNHKVENIPMGKSSLYNPPSESHLKKINNGAAAGGQANRLKAKLREPNKPGQGDFVVDNSVNRAKKKSVTGHQNLVPRRSGLVAVIIGGIHLGVHTVEDGIKLRDNHREKHNLPAAEY
jgi:hypothetical protein